MAPPFILTVPATIVELLPTSAVPFTLTIVSVLPDGIVILLIYLVPVPVTAILDFEVAILMTPLAKAIASSSLSTHPCIAPLYKTDALVAEVVIVFSATPTEIPEALLVVSPVLVPLTLSATVPDTPPPSNAGVAAFT